jgi:signal transduction histidine kinase/CheY-like chemotaxis protein
MLKKMTKSSTTPKILYVDDEEENLLVFKSSFRRNYDVLTALSGKEALEILSEQYVDVIISDQRMPQLNGVELLNSLPEGPENVRMILTGYTDIETVITALNEGKIHKYISKPWEKIALKKIIDAELVALQKRRKNAGEEVGVSKSNKKSNARADSTVPSGSKAAATNDKEVSRLKSELQESYNYLLLLSEIGQDIIENKSVKSIIEKTYGAINSLLDATVFACGIYNPDKKVLEYTIMEEGEWLSGEINLQDKNKTGVWTFLNKREIYSNDWNKEAIQYLGSAPGVVAGKTANSLIYLPLLQDDEAIGVLTVQSFDLNAYSNYQLNIMKNMAVYVATALENAKAYGQIEQQKQEIEAKNTELEWKVEERTKELQVTNLEVQKQRDEVENMYTKVKLLGEIGQQVTSTLSLDAITGRVYENLNALMDATIFGIGVFNEQEQRLEFYGAMEKGVQLPFWSVTLKEEDRIPIWCFTNQKEVIISDFKLEYNKYIKTMSKPKAGEDADSILYLPLVAGERKIGVITIQSFKKHAYSSYHLDILRSLGSYLAIAIQNAQSYSKMTEAFEKLKSAQTQLVESEKMASLGVLTAGVAHEINNPVNFISGGIMSLEENYEEVEILLKKLLTLNPDMSKSALKNFWDEIQEMVIEIDLDSLLPEIKDLIASIGNGAKRSMEIVKGLKNFSRLDERDMKEANLEEGIDSTLVILNNQLKNSIDIKRDYSGIPPILCFPGQLNQVFMNISNNAIHAIDEKGTITISTKSDESTIAIRISDNGKGISKEVQEHIFEPFYTTKGVGEGTGLGLSISYGIITKHNGSIEVESEIDKGTSFIIKLPIEA